MTGAVNFTAEAPLLELSTETFLASVAGCVRCYCPRCFKDSQMLNTLKRGLLRQLTLLLLPCFLCPRYNHNQVPNPYDEGFFNNCASVWCVCVPLSKVQFR
jgi:hypothetical protein